MSEQNNFEELRRLLKLKQHEVPPPGYFNHFSGDVIARIRTGEGGGAHGLFESIEGTWMMDLLQVFQAKPGIIGGFATSLCLLLLIGVVMVDRSEVSSPATVAVDSAMAPAAADGSQDLASVATLLPAGDSGITLNTNAVHSLQPAPALFGAQQNPLFQNASFVQPGQ